MAVTYAPPLPNKEPMVGSQLNSILLKMVEESLETRASFDDLQEACSQQRLDSKSVKEEVNKLVTYVMGTAPEVKPIINYKGATKFIHVDILSLLFLQLSSSEYGDTDMDDANLESEVTR